MQTSVAKKIFAVGVAASTVLMSLAPFAAQAAAHAEGTNIKASDGTVYMIIGGQRRPYTSAGAFLSYGFNSWSSVVDANADDLALPVGSFIPPQDGKIICSDRGADKGTCYLITGGQKAGFTSAAVFTGLGFSFARAQSGDVSWMTSTTNIDNTTAAHRPGVLVNNNGTVYLVGATGLLGIPDIATFNSWGYSFADVVVANAADKAMSQTGVMAARTAGQLSPTALTSSNNNVVSGSVSAMLASDTPAAQTIVAGQAAADLAHFAFSGTGTVTKVVVKRIGVSSDNTPSNVYLYNGSYKLTDAGSFSNGMVTFSNSSGLFTVNGTMVISVKADIAGNTTGQTVGAQLAAFAVANGSDVSTSISGNTMTIATVSDPATVSITQLVTDPGTSIQAGTMNATLWSQPFNIGTRMVYLKYVNFKQIGSIPNDAIQNIKLLVDGNQVGTASLDSNNNLVFDMSANPVALNTGSRTLELHGDVVKGSSKTFRFSIQTAADIAFVDSNYGFNVSMTATTPGVIPITNNTTTISSGTVSVQVDPSFTTNQVVNNTPGVTLAKFTMKAYGEDVKVQSLKVLPQYTGTIVNTEGFNNVAIYVDGSQVGSSQNWICTGTNTCPTLNAYGSSNLFTLTAGTARTVEIKGDLTLISGTSVTAVSANLQVPANSFQGVFSYATTPSAATTYTPSQTLSVVATSLSKSKNFSFADQTVSPNVTKQKIGSFTIQAGNAEPVRVTQFSVALGGTLPVTYLANLYISDNTTPVNPQASQNFSVNFTLQPNETHNVDVFVDIGNVGTADLGSTTVVTLGATATGVNSGTSASFTGLTGQTITVNTPTVTLPTADDGSGAVSQLVLGGSTLNQAASFKVVSTNGTTVIKELKFKVVGANGTSPLSNGVMSVAVGSVSAPVLQSGSDYIAYLTGLNLTVPSGAQGLQIQPSVTYNNVGTNAATTGTTARIALSYIKYNKGTGADITNSTLSATSSPMVLVATIPTIQKNSGSPNMASGYVPDANSEILRFDVIPSSGGTINLNKITFTPVYSATASTTNLVKLYDVTSDPGMNTVLGSVAIGASGVAKSITLSSDKAISGSGHTFVLKADTSTGWTWSANNSIRFDLTAANDLAEGTGTDWQWNDNTVGTGTYLNGYLVKNLIVTGGTLVK